VKVKGFTLICHFAGGEIIKYDMNDIKNESGPMAQPLKKKSYFAKVFVESGVPTWPNGYDVSPELIYREGERIEEVA
jgi:hypothetical protein